MPLAAVRLFHSERDDLRFRELLSVDDQGRMIAIMGTDVPDDVHQEPTDTTIPLCHHVVTRKPFESRIERPFAPDFIVDDVDVIVPITMLRRQFMSGKTRMFTVPSRGVDYACAVRG